MASIACDGALIRLHPANPAGSNFRERQVANSKQALVVGAAAEAANQVSYAEGNGGSRVRTLLYGCTHEVVGLAGAFADGFRGSGRRFLRLSVDILQSTLRLLCLALELRFHVAGGSSESFFDLATKVLGVTGKAIFIHGRIPSEIYNFNGWNGRRFPVRHQKCQWTIWRSEE